VWRWKRTELMSAWVVATVSDGIKKFHYVERAWPKLPGTHTGD
jgi:hypothetical protein